MGANHADSYFSVSVEPGERRVCAALQTSLDDQRVELVHFTAEPAKSHDYRTRLLMPRDVELLELVPNRQRRCAVSPGFLSFGLLAGKVALA